jgi:arylsulfatase
MIWRHMANKRKYPDRKPTFGMPYDGIANLRPETKQLRAILKAGVPSK